MYGPAKLKFKTISPPMNFSYQDLRTTRHHQQIQPSIKESKAKLWGNHSFNEGMEFGFCVSLLLLWELFINKAFLFSHPESFIWAWNVSTDWMLWNKVFHSIKRFFFFKFHLTLTHCGRVTQICVFNTVKLGTSASSP